jgi:hypothetical protein
MKRLDELKKEKEHLARQVEMEEENITNKLSKKLEKVKQEKVSRLVAVLLSSPLKGSAVLASFPAGEPREFARAGAGVHCQ